jgi:hypothetical protein
MQRERLPVVNQLPPNFEAILAVLPQAAEPGVMFAYGDRVYFPNGGKTITRELEAHEAIHLIRQSKYPGGPDAWWDKYLKDKDFRFKEEVLSHRAEYAMFCRRHLCQVKRAAALKQIAGRLASDLYGSLVTQAGAEILVGGTPPEM